MPNAAAKISDGMTIGPWRVVRHIGAGAVGAVYEIRHVQLNNRMALKAFVFDGADAAFFRKRFLAEGRLLARLRHPGVVRVYDMGVEDSFAWFVMDYVEGPDGTPKTLGDMPQAGGLPEAQIAGWYEDIRAALAFVHAEGVVHRDVKLQNILVRGDGHAVLSDFGVSRIADAKLRSELELSCTMALGDKDMKRVLGTAAYLAPEIIAGGEPTAATDHYALGVAFFRLLTGMWYEPGPRAFDLLIPFDPRWRALFAALLAEDPAHRSAPPFALAQRRRRKALVALAALLASAALAAALAAAFLLDKGSLEDDSPGDFFDVPSYVP